MDKTTTPQFPCPQNKTRWWKTSSVLNWGQVWSFWVSAPPTQKRLTLSLTRVSQPLRWVFSLGPISKHLPPEAAMEGIWIWKVEPVRKPRAGHHRKTGVPWIPGKTFYQFVSPTSRGSRVPISGWVPGDCHLAGSTEMLDASGWLPAQFDGLSAIWGYKDLFLCLVPSSPWRPPKKRSSGDTPSLASQASHWTPVGVGVKGLYFYKIGHGFCFLSTCYVLGPLHRALHTLAHWLLTKPSEVGIILPILQMGNREAGNLPKVTQLVTDRTEILI